MIDDDGPDLNNAELFLDSHRGVYIPRDFAQSINRKLVTGISEENYQVLASGPDHELYWETWDRVLDRAVIKHPEKGECYLFQDGDLWVVPRKDLE